MQPTSCRATIVIHTHIAIIIPDSLHPGTCRQRQICYQSTTVIGLRFHRSVHRVLCSSSLPDAGTERGKVVSALQVTARFRYRSASSYIHGTCLQHRSCFMAHGTMLAAHAGCGRVASNLKLAVLESSQLTVRVTRYTYSRRALHCMCISQSEVSILIYCNLVPREYTVRSES